MGRCMGTYDKRMKRSFASTLLFVCTLTAVQILPAPSVSAQNPQPAVELTIRNFDSLKKSIAFATNEMDPTLTEAALNGLLTMLGMSDISEIDPQKPWQIALWFERFGTSPSMSFRIPVANLDNFKSNLSETSILSPNNEDSSIRQIDGYSVFLASFTPLTEAMKQVESSWKPSHIHSLPNPDLVLSAQLNFDDTLRSSLQQLLGFSKKMVVQSIRETSEYSQSQALPFNGGQLAEMMVMYFNFLDAIIKDMHHLNFGVGAISGDMDFYFHWDPVDGSLTEKCFATPKGDLLPLLKFLPAGKTGYFAARAHFPEEILPGVRQLMNASLSLQNINYSTEEMDSLMGYLSQFLTYNAAGYIDHHHGFQLGMAYQFETPADKAVESFKNYFESPAFQAMSGEGKMFKNFRISDESISYQNKNIPTHKISMDLNFESPLLSMPGQKEILNLMYGGSSVQYEMTAIEDYVLYSMNAPIQDLLTESINSSEFTIQPNTILMADIDGWPLIKYIMSELNAHDAPENTPDKIKQIDSASIKVHSWAHNEFYSTLKLSANWLKLLSAIK